jgi:tRNA (adenine22-N1)-methyltransferase
VKLSKRLLTCARYTDGFVKVADIGTDHALLPIHCVNEGYVLNALAIDNKEGPYVIAFSNVKKQGLENKIEVILGDGINKIDEDVDVVVISGMGGGLIANILTNDPVRNVKRFVLQPNNDSKSVRESLIKIGFKIIDELVIKDNHKFYDIIVAEPGEMELTSFVAEFGPINLNLKPYFYVERINKEIAKLEKVAENLKGSPNALSVRARIQLLKEALK